MKARTYSILLLKEEIDSFEAALDPEKRTTPYQLDSSFAVPGTLYVGRQNRSTPDWVNLLNPYLTAPLGSVYSASIAAVLLLNYENRIFAVCFGYGKSLLAASSWVRDFGLKVTLNRVDPTKLRSVDTKTYEDMVLSTRKQVSRSSGMDNFDLDIARDLIRGVTGEPETTTFYKRLTGSDSLSVTSELPFADFGDLLDELLAAYRDTRYRANFGWIDNVREVDAALKERLDQILIASLRTGNVDSMHMAPADVVDWDDIHGFSFTGARGVAVRLELSLDHYLEVLGDKLAELSLEQLKRHRVRVQYEASEDLRPLWSVYECLVWETDFESQRYVFFDGRWFAIDVAFARRVQTYVASISRTALTLPQGEIGEDEGDYNESVAESDRTRFALLDKKNIRPEGAASPIEFCDLMTTAGQFIHVKKRSSSATLSHLFSQGSVACDVFLRDQLTRQQVRGKLLQMRKSSHAALITTERPTPARFEVIYAVLSTEGRIWPPPLPFFSAVNLMHHGSRIQNLGFRVSLQHVKLV